MERLAKPPPTKRARCNTCVFGIHLGFETKQCFQAYLWSIDACAVWPLQHKDYIYNNNHLIHTKRQQPNCLPSNFPTSHRLIALNLLSWWHGPWVAFGLWWPLFSVVWHRWDDSRARERNGEFVHETAIPGRGCRLVGIFVMNLSSVDYPPHKKCQ